MKTIRNFALIIGMMICFANVSCSDETGKTKNTTEQLLKDDPKPTALDSSDPHYQMMLDFGEFIIKESYTKDTETGEPYWHEVNNDNLQAFFNTYPAEKRPTMVCHEHCACCPSQHLVTVLADGNYFQVLVTDGNPPKVNSIVNFGSNSPCGYKLCP